MANIVLVPINKLKPNPLNARTHSKKQIKQIAASIKAFGFRFPILADDDDVIIAGHGRLEAAKLLGLSEVPAIRAGDLSDASKRALMIAANAIATKAGWDRERLAIELPALTPLLLAENIEISITGFEIPEIDQLLVDFEESSQDPADEAPGLTSGRPVSSIGDIWILGNHRLGCGNARLAADVDRLMNGEMAAMCFLDPPYNVAVAGVVGRGKIKHREFAEASGEMSSEAFVEFLKGTLGNAARVSRAGALNYVCMDWRHMGELLEASKATYDGHINTCIWTKTNAGQGSFYRSAHEQIAVFRVGPGSHLNNVELGRHGRSRSNVWPYAGVNTFRAGRLTDLASHPTVKPIALVSDAMRDCTKRDDIVLDLFCGSGTTLLAAEKVGRRGYGLEIDPAYVDVAIRRWQQMTGKDAVHSDTKRTFDDIETASTAAREA
ncbi:MAG: ParB N-terminal domain-containing protein [Afipia sp.]|uniref:site-specific DNA-methyltransferase n=1 Tax=Afipia sp. DC4300-2b1 TaxID=2804672 RepID=UPI003CE8F51D|nr:ParB N-terminal domain-containing protein [Afipia sp.]